MGGLIVAFVMSFTAITVVLVGILAAYAAVTGILYAFACRSQRRSQATTATAVLTPSQSQASGD